MLNSTVDFACRALSLNNMSMDETSHPICLCFNHHNATGQIPISIDDFKAQGLFDAFMS